MLPGIGVFKGKSGDNNEHCHWAHQISIGLDGPIKFHSGEQEYCVLGGFIRAGTPHKLAPYSVLSLYLDPTSLMANVFIRDVVGDAEIIELPDSLNREIRSALEDLSTFEESVSRLYSVLGIENKTCADERLSIVVDALYRGVREQGQVDRSELAHLVNLSESRFSHWFKQETGMPLRSYRKWLRILYGLEVTMKGRNLTDAAHEANFSDQAHFTRAFKQAFGVNPSVALRDVQSVI